MINKIVVAVLGVLITGCASVQNKKADVIVLNGSEWIADSLNTDYKLDNVRPTIEFGDSSSLTGFAGCNRFFGEYTLSEDTLNVNIAGITMMSCPDDVLESQFLSLMSQVAFCELEEENVLIVKDMNMDFVGKFSKK